MRLEPDFEELLRLFNKNKVRYCVVGAFAMAFHGKPRFTQDMDILVEPAQKNASAVVKSLLEFGFGKLDLTAKDFSRPGTIVQLGFEPVRVDIMTSVTGCSFGLVWKHRKAARYGRQNIYIIGLDELITNKRATRRKQDAVDIDTLLETKKNKKGV